MNSKTNIVGRSAFLYANSREVPKRILTNCLGLENIIKNQRPLSIECFECKCIRVKIEVMNFGF